MHTIVCSPPLLVTAWLVGGMRMQKKAYVLDWS